MGSSKKHKDKGREEKKHKHRDRDRDKDKKRHKHKRRRSRSKDRDEDRKKRKGSDSPILLTDSPVHEPTPDRPTTEAPAGDGSFRESLSIEETNKIRVKLGLAPLKVDSDKKEGEEVLYDDRPDVHKPAVNLAAKKESEKIQEKLALIREKRRQHKKLQKVKTISEAAGDLEDASSWVKRSRKAQKEREMAEKQAKILQEMDEEFGISDLLDDELKKEKSEAYSAKDMAGLKVEHDTADFKDGSSVILTLKDADVLGEEGDVLVNYNMIDMEKAKKNIELKKKMPGYVAYDDTVEDEYGMLRPKSLLSKYDEEIDGVRKRSFQLDAHGTVDTGADRVTNSLKEQLKAQAISLESRPLTIASEYYTAQEMDAFKKPRKKKRRLKKKNIVDELVAMQAEVSNEDHGSREKMPDEVEEGEIEEPKEEQVVDMDIETQDDGEEKEQEFLEDDWGPPIEDEAEKELQNVLNKARKIKQKKERKKQRIEEQVAAVITNVKVEPGVKIEPSQEDSKSIVLHSTSEFCRALGDIPTYGTSGNRNEDKDDEEMDLEERDEDDDIQDEVMDEAKGWNQVNPDDEEENKEDELGPVLEEEPDIRPGCMGALKLAVKKGYLGVEQQKKLHTVSSKNKHMEARNFVVEDKNYNDIDAKYNKHERGQYRGPLQDFKDKDGYTPDFKLTYMDESGRELNQKEAFRHLSHRFHGKGSGKLKTEKRLKKVLEEEAMKKMSSTDTPLHTVARMQEKQKEMQTPYIVLSGGGKNLATNPITK